MSVGDGCSIAGAWKAFRELKTIGLIARTPRMIGVQAAGAAPITEAFRSQQPMKPKSAEEIAHERARDPLQALHALLVPALMAEDEWQRLDAEARAAVDAALARVERRAAPDASAAGRFVFCESGPDGSALLQSQGGMRADGVTPPEGTPTPRPDGPRINMLTAIRRTLERELGVNPRVVVFGEDVGRKGGVHAATLGSRFPTTGKLQHTFSTMPWYAGKPRTSECAGHILSRLD